MTANFGRVVYIHTPSFTHNMLRRTPNPLTFDPHPRSSSRRCPWCMCTPWAQSTASGRRRRPPWTCTRVPCTRSPDAPTSPTSSSWRCAPASSRTTGRCVAPPCSVTASDPPGTPPALSTGRQWELAMSPPFILAMWMYFVCLSYHIYSL